jgi:hypothetical protein
VRLQPRPKYLPDKGLERQQNLESEDVQYGKSDPSENLEENGAAKEEIEFLCTGGDWSSGYFGQRVELNQFTSGDLVKWIESKLEESGIKKVVPDKDTLADAYRRAAQVDLLRNATEEIMMTTRRQVEAMSIPKNLEKRMRKILKDNPMLSWDEAVAEVASEQEDL